MTTSMMMLFTAFFLIMLNSMTNANVNIRGGRNQLNDSQKYELLERILTLTPKDIQIKSIDREVHREYRRKVLEKIGETSEIKCAYSINNLTYYYSTENPYREMRMNSGADIADMGDRDACVAMENVARYYVLSIGLKQLPLELRFGMCLPYECTPEIMSAAMQKMTDTMNNLLGPMLENPPVPLPTDVVPVFHFKLNSPEQWKEDKTDERAVSSKIFAAFVAVLAFLVVSGKPIFNNS
jgi:hypothetical protein